MPYGMQQHLCGFRFNQITPGNTYIIMMRRIVVYAVVCLFALVSCEDAKKADSQPVKVENITKKKAKRAVEKKSVEKQDDTQVYKQALKAEIADVNGKLPVQVEQGVTVTKFTVEGNDAVYYYMCDEQVVSKIGRASCRERV